MIVWSNGFGTQSMAMGVLIANGTLPKPDIIVGSDTGREATETWEYFRDHMQPYLAKHGMTVEIVPHSFAACDLYARDGETLLVPAWTETGKLTNYCSGEWKRDVIERWLRKVKEVKGATMWLGIS